MKEVLVLVLAAVPIVPFAASCAKSPEPAGTEPVETDKTLDAILAAEPVMDPVVMNSQVGFDFALFRSVAAQDSTKNVVLSPASAKIALAMAYNGASG